MLAIVSNSVNPQVDLLKKISVFLNVWNCSVLCDRVSCRIVFMVGCV